MSFVGLFYLSISSSMVLPTFCTRIHTFCSITDIAGLGSALSYGDYCYCYGDRPELGAIAP